MRSMGGRIKTLRNATLQLLHARACAEAVETQQRTGSCAVQTIASVHDVFWTPVVKLLFCRIF